MAFIIVLNHPERDPRYFCRFNGFAGPTFNEDKRVARRYPTYDHARVDADKVREKCSNAKDGEECSVDIEEDVEKLENENTTDLIQPVLDKIAIEEVSEIKGWIEKKDERYEGRSLWVKFFSEAEALVAAICIDTGEILETGYYRDVVKTFMSWKTNTMLRKLGQYEERRISALPDMRSGT